MRRHAEPSRIRAGGTVVTAPTTPGERIAAIRAILATGQYAKVDGVMVDTFSASAIVAVYDALNETNQIMFAGFPVGKMARVAFKLVK